VSTDRKPMPVAEWLTSLGVLCAGSMSREEAMARVAAYRTALASEFEPRAFCAASVRHVARASKFWPSFGEVCTALGEWWKDNRDVGDGAPRLSSDGHGRGGIESRERYEPVYSRYAEKYGRGPLTRIREAAE
jgi:hypothetical protein